MTPADMIIDRLRAVQRLAEVLHALMYNDPRPIAVRIGLARPMVTELEDSSVWLLEVAREHPKVDGMIRAESRGKGLREMGTMGQLLAEQWRKVGL